MELQIPLPQWKIKNRHGVIQQRAIYRERNGPSDLRGFNF